MNKRKFHKLDKLTLESAINLKAELNQVIEDLMKEEQGNNLSSVFFVYGEDEYYSCEAPFEGICWDDESCEYLEKDDYKKYDIVITDVDEHNRPSYGYVKRKVK